MSYAITRGLGGSASSMISRGWVGSVGRLIKGSSRFVKKVAAIIEENIKISVMLISANGKEFTNPIINKVSRTFNPNENLSIRLLPKTLTIRKAKDIKVSIEKIKVRNNRKWAQLIYY